MRIEKCWFCSAIIYQNIYQGHGLCFVRNNNIIFRFVDQSVINHLKREEIEEKLNGPRYQDNLEIKSLLMIQY